MAQLAPLVGVWSRRLRRLCGSLRGLGNGTSLPSWLGSSLRGGKRGVATAQAHWVSGTLCRRSRSAGIVVKASTARLGPAWWSCGQLDA